MFDNLSGSGILGAVYLFLSAGASYFTKGITGFGNTLIMASLFSFLIPNRLTTPVDLFLSIPTNTWLVLKNRKSLSLKLVAPLCITVIIGAIPGALLLKTGSDWLLKGILGLVIIGIALDMLYGKGKNSVKNRKHKALLMAGTGLASGVLAGLYGISALLVSYIGRNTENREAFRANLCLVFLADNIFRLMVYFFSGIITIKVIELSLFTAPAVFLGMWLGVKADKKMSEKTVRLAVIALLIISGGALFIRSIFFQA